MLTKEIVLSDDCTKESAKNANKIQTINYQQLEQMILKRSSSTREINFHKSCNFPFGWALRIYTSESAQYSSFGRKHENKTKFTNKHTQRTFRASRNIKLFKC